jgi:SAM-dependent methyltransferase
LKKLKILAACAACIVILAGSVRIVLLNKNDLTGVFNRVYIEGWWGRDASNRGWSGTGSTLEITKEYRAFIEDFIVRNRITSVVDAGCGDWNFSKDIDWHGAQYVGIDISTVVLERVKKKYENEHVTFWVGDATEELPAADLLICKDVLQHLPNRLIQKFIKNNLKKGKYRWAIITNDMDKKARNSDIPVGGYRGIDLSAPPFNVRGLVNMPVIFGEQKAKTVQVLRLED